MKEQKIYWGAVSAAALGTLGVVNAILGASLALVTALGLNAIVLAILSLRD